MRSIFKVALVVLLLIGISSSVKAQDETTLATQLTVLNTGTVIKVVTGTVTTITVRDVKTGEILNGDLPVLDIKVGDGVTYFKDPTNGTIKRNIIVKDVIKK